MSAEFLREAAALMRVRAEAANEGPWVRQRHHNGTYNIWCEPEGGGRFELGGDFVAPDAAHIAPWHPEVALAVADWLDEVVDLDETLKNAGSRGYVAESACMKVAAAYLGRQP